MAAKAEGAGIVRDHFSVFGGAFNDPFGKELQVVMHHLVSDFMDQSVVSEILVLEPGFTAPFKAEAGKRNFEDHVTAVIDASRILRATVVEIVFPGFVEGCLIALERWRRVTNDSPGEGGYQKASGFEGAGNFRHDAASEFVLGYEFEGVGLVDVFSVLRFFGDEFELFHGPSGDFDLIGPGTFLG